MPAVPPETQTANYGWVKPYPTGSVTTWGATLNADLDAIDSVVHGLANPANFVITSAPGTSVKGSLTFQNGDVTAGPTQVRWVLGMDTATESGTAVGSDLSLKAYNNSGVQISTPMGFTRSTGAVAFSGPATFAGTATFGGTLAVTGAATFSSTIAVTGAATITGALTATGGVVGVTDGSDAGAGKVGEFVNASVAQGSALALTSATPRNITTLTLTAGDWEVYGNLLFTSTGGPTATTLVGGVSTTSAAFGSSLGVSVLASSNIGAVTAPIVRVSSASSTTVYLVAEANFIGGTISGYGSISARRVR